MGRPKGRAKTGGRKRGTKNTATLSKEAARERLRALIEPEMAAMTRAQIEHCKGVSYMMLRRPDGTYARATDEKQINAAVAAGGISFEIFTQTPSQPAYSDLMNRYLDKPKEQEQEISVKGEVDVLVRKLASARKRGTR